MQESIAQKFSLTKEEALQQLTFEKGIHFARDIISRSPPLCYQGDSREFLLQLVHCCLWNQEYLLLDTDSLTECIELMISKGADCNAHGSREGTAWLGQTPLHIVAAQSKTHPGIALALSRCLLKQSNLDANIVQRSGEANTAAHIAALSAQHALVSMLEPRCDFSLTNAAGLTVHQAVAAGAAKKLDEQLAAAVKVVLEASKGSTTVDLTRALTLLKTHNSAALRSADIADSGMSILGICCAQGHLEEILGSLLRSGLCDANASDVSGNFPEAYLHDRPVAYRQKVEEMLARHRLENASAIVRTGTGAAAAPRPSGSWQRGGDTANDAPETPEHRDAREIITKKADRCFVFLLLRSCTMH